MARWNDETVRRSEGGRNGHAGDGGSEREEK